MIALSFLQKKITPQQAFMLSALIVNAGNYVYNLILGRLLGPAAFADAAIIITLLLVLSFAAMTFQLGTARFMVLLKEEDQAAFLNKITRWGLRTGIAIGALFILFAENLQSVFQTDSKAMFIVFGFAVPLYFLMSINRGIFQGKQDMWSLAKTYQFEMWGRLVLTLLCILLFRRNPAIGVAVGVGLSLFIAQFPKSKNKHLKLKFHSLNPELKSEVIRFFMITAFYEGTQILINNSDILMVKHYFDSYEAGLYASLALIGRVVYFVAWMFVMILLPVVVEKHKNGENTQGILMKYVGYIASLASSIVVVCFVTPHFIVNLLFGEAYIEVAHLLGPYALATGLFALANLFAYYFLSLGKYIPVFIGFVGGFLQIVFVICFHDTLLQVILAQNAAMVLLMLAQISYYYYFSKFKDPN